MTLTARPLRAKGAGTDGSPLFRHEARREGKIVAALVGVGQLDGTVVVETTVTPPGGKPDDALRRPFSFPHVEAAHRFAAETVLALEYLGCDVVE